MNKTSSIRELREDLNISQGTLASLAEVSRHSIIRSEQLCYPNPLPSVVTALSDLTGISEGVIESQYYSDVFHNREHTGLLLEPHFDFLLALTQQLIVNSGLSGSLTSVHPFAVWRMTVSDLLKVSSSQIHFSMMTSIHPATLFKYEDFKTGFPVPMGVALREIGFSETQLSLFEGLDIFNWIRR